VFITGSQVTFCCSIVWKDPCDSSWLQPFLWPNIAEIFIDKVFRSNHNILWAANHGQSSSQYATHWLTIVTEDFHPLESCITRICNVSFATNCLCIFHCYNRPKAEMISWQIRNGHLVLW